MSRYPRFQVDVPLNPNVKVKWSLEELILVINTIYIYLYIFYGLNGLIFLLYDT